MFVILIAAVPTALAGWAGMGNLEPDVARDISDHWMELDPRAGDMGNHVYFNGFMSEDLTGVSPNVGTLSTGMSSSGTYSYWAMLGVWRDCNGDGFVGFGDQGLFEYRSELLVGPYDTHLCPAETTPTTPPLGAPPLNWMPSHNDGKWVREFLSIQWLQWDLKDTFHNAADGDPYNVNDNASRVWADSGQPEDQAGTGCAINPQPRGTYHSVGGALQFFDCYDRFVVTDNFDTAVAAAGDPLGMSFADAPRDQGHSDSSLNIHNPWGEQEDAGYVQAWDCSQDQPVQLTNQQTPSVEGVTSPINYSVTNVSAPNTAPTPNLSGSPAGTANSTMSGVDQCDRRSDVSGGGTGGSYARTPYSNEADISNAVIAKTKSVSVLAPFEAARSSAPVSTALGKSTPTNFGVTEPGQYSGANSLWHNPTHWVGGRPTFSHTTYYAYVSPTAVSAYGLLLPPGGTGAYGAETCLGQTSGVWNGWECDPANWYRDTNGNDITPRTTFLGPSPGIGYAAKPGSPFNLRDIDCNDQSAGALRGVGAGPWQVWDMAEPVPHDVIPSAPWEQFVGKSPHVC